MSLRYMKFLRKMTDGGFRGKPDSWSFVLTNEDLLCIAKTIGLPTFMQKQQCNYMQKIINQNNKNITKKLMFDNERLVQ